MGDSARGESQVECHRSGVSYSSATANRDGHGVLFGFVESGEFVCQWEDGCFAAIEDALLAEGIRHSGTKPQLIVAYHTGVQERSEYRDTGWGVGHSGYGYSAGYSRSRVEEVRYLEGTLMVDLVDAEKNSLVWRGRATGVVGDYEQQESRIVEAVTAMFERYPPVKK